MKLSRTILGLFTLLCIVQPVTAGEQGNTQPANKTAIEFKISDYPALQAIQTRLETESRALLQQFQQGQITEAQLMTRKQEMINRYNQEMKAAKQPIIDALKKGNQPSPSPKNQLQGASATTKPVAQMSKTAVGSIIRNITRSLNELRNKVESDTAIDAATKTRLSASVNNMITEVNLKNDNLAKATTQAEISAVGADIKSYWKTNKLVFLDIKQSLITPRAKQPLETTEKMVTTVEKRLADAKKLGYNITAAQGMTNKAKASIAEAKANYQWITNHRSPTTEATRLELKQQTQQMTKNIKAATLQIKAAISNLNNQPIPTK